MLSLKQGLSLESIRLQGKWSPDDEASLVAWYQNQVGISLNGSDVSEWKDSSSNSYDMLQATASEQPAYSGGVLSFVAADNNHLQTTSGVAGQISLTGDFTLGLRINPNTTNGAFIGDNTTAGDYFKFAAADRISFKIANSASSNLDLASGTFGDDYIVITRESNVVSLWHNGVSQLGATATVAGTALIDCIGVRRVDINDYEGDIEEIQIYSSSSSALTANVNDRLATL
jgi:hypothetical protein